MTDVTRMPPEHGGNLAAMSRRHDIAPEHWLDLSTGINPWPYPITSIDAAGCRALPDHDQRLHIAATRYYLGARASDVFVTNHSPRLLNVPGSQWAIERLPQCFERGSVALPEIGYREHAWRWQQGGHQLRFYDSDGLSAHAMLTTNDLRAVVVINPNNPGGQHYTPTELFALATHLSERGVFLIVDEAFADSTPEQSLLPTLAENIIVLRSLGKFFGLAGLRLGAVIGTHQKIMQQLSKMLGPWAISTPSQLAGTEALADAIWQSDMRDTLKNASPQQGQQLMTCLDSHGDVTRWRQCALFNAFDMPTQRARLWHTALAERAVLTRLWEIDETRAILRIGLHDDSPPARRQLNDALNWAQSRAAGSAT